MHDCAMGQLVMEAAREQAILDLILSAAQDLACDVKGTVNTLPSGSTSL